MNYRHAYHAGNFADVLKHAVLALIIDYMKLKAAPLRVIDTHAGPGRYDLTSMEAQKTGEWRSGIGRLLGPGKAEFSDAAAALLAPYLDVVRADNHTDAEGHDGAPARYPGSPWLARKLLRHGDKLIVNELHKEDHAALVALFARDKQVSVLGIDGWSALKSLLPPRERRGIILVDPPFEEPGDLEQLAAGLRHGLKRFASGVFLLWYPIKDRAAVAKMQRDIAALGLDKCLRVEVSIGDPEQSECPNPSANPNQSARLTGCGLIILNPPYILKEQLGVLLPELSAALGCDGAGSFSLDWLTG